MASRDGIEITGKVGEGTEVRIPVLVTTGKGKLSFPKVSQDLGMNVPLMIEFWQGGVYS